MPHKSHMQRLLILKERYTGIMEELTEMSEAEVQSQDVHILILMGVRRSIGLTKAMHDAGDIELGDLVSSQVLSVLFDEHRNRYAEYGFKRQERLLDLVRQLVQVRSMVEIE